MKIDKRATESDAAHSLRTRCKAVCHAAKRAAKRAGPLPYGYARGSTIYAAAYYGREVNAADIQRMQAEQYKPLEIVANAAE